MIKTQNIIYEKEFQDKVIELFKKNPSRFHANLLVNLINKRVINFVKYKTKTSWIGVTLLDSKKILINTRYFLNVSNKNTLKDIYSTIVHEITHLLAQASSRDFFSTFNDVIFLFYKVLWQQLVIPSESGTIAKRNLFATMTLESEKDSFQQNMALNLFYDTVIKYREMFYSKDMYHAVLDTIKNVTISYRIQRVIANSYDVIYNAIPKAGFGQEFRYGSEIIALSSDCWTSKAEKVSKRVLVLANKVLT